MCTRRNKKQKQNEDTHNSIEKHKQNKTKLSFNTGGEPKLKNRK